MVSSAIISGAKCLKCLTGVVGPKDDEVICYMCGFRFESVRIDVGRPGEPRTNKNFDDYCEGSHHLPVSGSEFKREYSQSADSKHLPGATYVSVWGRCRECGKTVRCLTTKNGIVANHYAVGQ